MSNPITAEALAILEACLIIFRAKLKEAILKRMRSSNIGTYGQSGSSSLSLKMQIFQPTRLLSGLVIRIGMGLSLSISFSFLVFVTLDSSS